MNFFKKNISDNKRKILGNASWLMTDKIFRMGTNLIIYPLLARYLGPADFGNFSYCLALITIFQMSVNLGLDQIVIRELITLKDKKHSILGTILGIKLTGATIGLILTTIFTFVIHANEHEVKVFMLILALSLFSQAFDAIRIWFESEVKFKYFAISSLIAFVISSSLKVAFIFMKMPLIYFISTFLIESGCIAVMLVAFYLKERGNILAWKFDIKLAIQTLKEALPILLSTIAVILNMKMDQILLKNISGATQLGVYSSAVKISEIWFTSIAVIISAIYPYIVKAKNDCLTTYSLRLDKLFQIMVIITVSFSVIVYLSSHYIITILYGPKFIDGVSILAIHAWAGIFVAMSIANNSWFVTQSLTKFTLIFALLGLFTNLILNIILIPKFHGIGAAWASIISHMFAGYIGLLFIPQTRELFWRQTRSILFLNTNKLFK